MSSAGKRRKVIRVVEGLGVDELPPPDTRTRILDQIPDYLKERAEPILDKILPFANLNEDLELVKPGQDYGSSLSKLLIYYLSPGAGEEKSLSADYFIHLLKTAGITADEISSPPAAGSWIKMF